MSWVISFELVFLYCTCVSDVVRQLTLREEAKAYQDAGLQLVTGSSQATSIGLLYSLC